MAYTATSLNVVMLVPHVFTTGKTKEAKGLSFASLIIFITANVFWLLYGMMIKAVPVIVSNAVLATLNLTLIVMKSTYRRN